MGPRTLRFYTYLGTGLEASGRLKLSQPVKCRPHQNYSTKGRLDLPRGTPPVPRCGHLMRRIYPCYGLYNQSSDWTRYFQTSTSRLKR